MCKRIALDSLVWKIKLFIIVVNLLTGSVDAQVKKWDGSAGDGQWSTASNWTDDILPSPADSVVFDNSFVAGNYNVSLPSGNATINIRWLVISSASVIQLRIPNSNTAVPALSATGIKLFSGAIFVNSSGAPSGVVINIADSLYILNGARFIQNSPTGHAAFVSRLSKATGTENGTFEFDVPNASSYTVSISGRTYGNLELKSTSAGVPKTYLSGGGQPLTINGSLFIGTGVTYSLDLTADLFINEQLTNHGVFNLANNPNNNTVKIKRGLYQQGVLTETSTGFPIIELNGTTNQDIQVSGNILNSITVRINNPGGATLLNSLNLPYRLELVQGRLTSSAANLLTLQAGCSIIADSMNQSAFVNGPLRKLGLSTTANFLFPVGKGITQRWLGLKNATGDFTIEFFKIDPHSLSIALGAGIHHISSIEYWTITSSASSSSKIELSFNNVNSGGVTDLSGLRVSSLIGSVWTDAGNAGTTGTAGSNGSVIGNDYGFSGGQTVFTLASSQAGQNPLPSGVFLSVVGPFLNWELPVPNGYTSLSVQASGSPGNFKNIAEVPIRAGQVNYSFPISDQRFDLYRLKLGKMDGSFDLSNAVAINRRSSKFELNGVIYDAAAGRLKLSIRSPKSGQARFLLTDQKGRVLKIFNEFIEAGNSRLSLPVNQLQTGIFYIFGLSSPLRTKTLRFINP